MWSLIVYTEEWGGRAGEEAIIQGMRDSCGVGAWIAMHYWGGRGGTEHTGLCLTLYFYYYCYTLYSLHFICYVYRSPFLASHTLFRLLCSAVFIV
jgi:hypothetical protein